jgi:hypothetical protein
MMLSFCVLSDENISVFMELVAGFCHCHVGHENVSALAQIGASLGAGIKIPHLRNN